MLYDGEWKLCRYITGETHLFNLRDDPDEQRNLLACAAGAEAFRRLDSLLSLQVMESVRVSHRDKRLFKEPPTEDKEFGARAWKRPYPYSLI